MIATKQRLSRRAGVTALVLTAAALFTGACAGGDDAGRTVASVGDGSASGATSTGATDDMSQGLAFAKCMRENGVPEFKDPERGKGMGEGLDTKSPAFKKAMDDCKEFAPPPPPGSQGSGDVWPEADKLKYSQCMRDNGVPGFPDPNAEGGFKLGEGTDPSTPQFRNAEDVCKKHQPGSLQTMVPNKPGGSGS